MKSHLLSYCIAFTAVVFFPSCNTLEKASTHGLNSGYYKLDYDKQAKDVYVNITYEAIDIYNQQGKKPDKVKFLSIPLTTYDSMPIAPLRLSKQSLDIDITTVLLKYRPAVYDLPPQLTADINIALYAGWRHDHYNITSKKDPWGKRYHKINNVGYDVGLFAGPGATPISPFTTQNKTGNEYNGMIVQTGISGFFESNIASFGVAVGFDYLLNRDRSIWIYNNKPWAGFIVGVALN